MHHVENINFMSLNFLVCVSMTDLEQILSLQLRCGRFTGVNKRSPNIEAAC